MFQLNSQSRNLFLALAAGIFPGLAADENPELEITTTNGYRLHIHSELQPIGINQMHSWLLELRDVSGLVIGAQITVEGGMPNHNHGLPTRPQVTEEIKPGFYLIEGIRFHMPGTWEMRFLINANNQKIEALLNFRL